MNHHADSGQSPAGRSRATIPTNDPALQVLESAHQILTMIGANPRAIRPILAQRRLSKDAVLAAAHSIGSRAAAALGDIDAAGATTVTATEQQRSYLVELRERAAKVVQVYQAV
jgi:hypothetical protein